MTSLPIVACKLCFKLFIKPLKEYNRSIKLGREFYCSRKCFGKDSFYHIPKDKRYHPENLLIGRQQRNQFSQFGRTMRHVRQSPIKLKTITLKDIKEQWDKQGGICPLTGWALKLPQSQIEKIARTPDRASLDRIDSSKGYTKDNIRFVALIAQFAKNSWADADVIAFCKAVAIRI